MARRLAAELFITVKTWEKILMAHYKGLLTYTASRAPRSDEFVGEK